MIHVNEEIEKSVFINAPVFVVWNNLTIPEQMKKWMLDTHMEMDVFTTWQVGSPITLRGNLHGMPFENTGKILKNELEQVLQYTHLSSLSELQDKPENYCLLTFTLKP